MKKQTIHIFIPFLLCFLYACSPTPKDAQEGNSTTIKVSMIVDFEGLSKQVTIEAHELSGPKNVRDLVVDVSKSGLLSFEESDHGELGHLLTSFNGVGAQGAKYWLYCINGKKASKGIDQQKLKEGDQVKWVLTSKSDPCK